MPFFDPASRLEDILAAIRDIEAFTSGQAFEHYMATPMMRRAVERSVEIFSEASRHLPAGLKARHPQIPWRRIADIGNVLRHAYKVVDDAELWEIVVRDLAPLKAAVETMLREAEADDRTWPRGPKP
jgi:uncharacterized protein with HEPN domain